MFYLAVLLGCVIFLLFQLKKAYYKKNFSWKVYFRDMWIPALINILCGFILVFAKEEIESIYPITFISAVVLGIAGQAVFKGIFESKSRVMSVEMFNEEENVK